jgi:hypothetical protein
MFKEISTMIELESEEPADIQRKRLLIAMADVRGFLGDARTKFRIALLSVHAGNRVTFKKSWDEFEQRLSLLTDNQKQFTEKQRKAFDRFKIAQKVFDENANSMLDVLYKTVDAPTKEAP